VLIQNHCFHVVFIDSVKLLPAKSCSVIRIIPWTYSMHIVYIFNPLNAELNPICRLLTLLGTHSIFHISRIRVNMVVDVFIHSSSSVFIFCSDGIISPVTSLRTENQIFVHDDEDLNLTWFTYGLHCHHHLQPSRNDTNECNTLTY
jgi:hypothetical protein